jgi:hypothetical protein
MLLHRQGELMLHCTLGHNMCLSVWCYPRILVPTCLLSRLMLVLVSHCAAGVLLRQRLEQMPLTDERQQQSTLVTTCAFSAVVVAVHMLLPFVCFALRNVLLQ